MCKAQRENNSKSEYTERLLNQTHTRPLYDRSKFRHTEAFASVDNHPKENSLTEIYVFGGYADLHYHVKVCVGRMPTHLHASMII